MRESGSSICVPNHERMIESSIWIRSVPNHERMIESLISVINVARSRENDRVIDKCINS